MWRCRRPLSHRESRPQWHLAFVADWFILRLGRRSSLWVPPVVWTRTMVRDAFKLLAISGSVPAEGEMTP